MITTWLRNVERPMCRGDVRLDEPVRGTAAALLLACPKVACHVRACVKEIKWRDLYNTDVFFRDATALESLHIATAHGQDPFAINSPDLDTEHYRRLAVHHADRLRGLESLSCRCEVPHNCHLCTL